jgi:translation initiation factor 2 alpha subunit (eIF-2alpha)
MLSLKRIPDKEIIKEIEKQTNKTITTRYLSEIRQQIKKDSYEWYKTMREVQHEYIHEFKERINEIQSLQKQHHEIIDNNKHNPQIQQTSLAELHRLSITLSNLFDVAPSIINNNGPTLSATSEVKTVNTEITV